MMNHDNLRQCERISLEASVLLRRPKLGAYEVGLEDFSPTGCRVVLRERLQPGQLVWITVPGLAPLQSKIRWQTEWQAGVEFERPIHIAVFDHFAARMRDGAVAQ